MNRHTTFNYWNLLPTLGQQLGRTIMKPGVLLASLVLASIANSSRSDDSTFESCGFKVRLEGTISEQKRSVPYNADATMHVHSRAALQHDGTLNTLVMCTTLSGEVDEEEKAFKPEVSLRRATARFENAGWELMESSLLNADEKTPNQRKYQFRMQKNGQVIVARGLVGNDPRIPSMYIIQTMARNDMETEVEAELERIIGTMTPLGAD